MQDLAPRMHAGLTAYPPEPTGRCHLLPQGYVGKGILLSTESVPHVSLDLTLQNHIDLFMKMFT